MYFSLLVLAPGDRVDTVIVLPRLHADDGSGKVCKVIQGASHRTEDTGNTLLPGHASVDTGFGPATCATTERIDPAPCGRDTDRASDIRANTNAATKSQESTLTTSRSTGGVGGNVRVETVTPERIGGLERQQGDWQGGFRIGHGTCLD